MNRLKNNLKGLSERQALSAEVPALLRIFLADISKSQEKPVNKGGFEWFTKEWII